MGLSDMPCFTPEGLDRNAQADKPSYLALAFDSVALQAFLDGEEQIHSYSVLKHMNFKLLKFPL